jgi:hypothetical protein
MTPILLDLHPVKLAGPAAVAWTDGLGISFVVPPDVPTVPQLPDPHFLLQRILGVDGLRLLTPLFQ